jgi:flagellar biosynthesis/type III secretory pathway protein FliH
MAAILKSPAVDDASRGLAFQYDDFAARAKEYLTQIRAEGDRILAQAKVEAEQLRNAAEAEARVQGLAAAERIALERAKEQLLTALPAWREAAFAIRVEEERWLAEWEHNLVSLAVAMAGKILRREARNNPAISSKILREALQAARGRRNVRIIIHPDDAELLRRVHGEMQAAFGDLAEVMLVSDAKMERGGCRLESEFGVVDLTFSAQLKRIFEELTD